jgi:CDP-glycerol glycerophosphotransferase (TagB/SpsB family)/glycosyltransferase involved in cell wall biosynthesis
VIAQTKFSSIKLLLIDDGSIDQSSEIARSYAERYDNIFYYYKENGGQSSARNFGLNLVDTAYVMFLDSDDILPPYACEKLYGKAVETNCSMVLGNLETFPVKTPRYLWKKYFGHGDVVIGNIYDYPDLIFLPSPCNRIFNMDYLRSKQFVFPEGLTFEDAYAILPLMLDGSPMAILDEVVYLYRKRDEGTSTMDNIYLKKKNYFDHLLVNEKLFSLIPENAPLHQKETIYKFIVRTFNGFLTAMAGRNKDVLNSDERTEIFGRLRAMYKTMPFYVFSDYLKNHSVRILYFSILENQLDLFLNPSIATNAISIEHGVSYLPLERTVTNRDYITCNWSIWMDYITAEEEDLVFYGTFNTSALALNKPLENKITFYFEDTATREAIGSFPAEFFRREDYKPHDGSLYHGIKVRIPFKELDMLLKNRYFLLKLKMEDIATNQSTTRKAIANFTLHRFKGTIKDHHDKNAAFLNIFNKKGIYLQKSLSFKQMLGSQIKRIFNTKKRRLKVGGKLRMLYWLSYPFLSRKDIVLIGERRDTFQDNSSHLFKYVRKEHSGENWYYLLDENSPQYSEAKKLGNVIKTDSLKHYLYLLHAKKLINSYDIESYMIPKGYAKAEFINRFGDLLQYKRVFLQHGISYNDISAAASRFRTANDLIVSSNTQETDFYIEKAHFTREQIITSGLPRYDRLAKHIREKELDNANRKQILLMPTWRSGLAKKSYLKSSKQQGASEQQFLDSEYYRFYNGLLSDPRVLQYLNENNAILNFYPHYEMRDYVHLFNAGSNERINILGGSNIQVQDLLIENDILITDYSSVFFDFAFMKKPIIFSQFDYEEFYKNQYKEGYFSFANQRIGPVIKNNDELLVKLNEITSRNYRMTEEQENYSQQFFDYFDGTLNSEKVYERVKES